MFVVLHDQINVVHRWKKRIYEYKKCHPEIIRQRQKKLTYNAVDTVYEPINISLEALVNFCITLVICFLCLIMLSSWTCK